MAGWASDVFWGIQITEEYCNQSYLPQNFFGQVEITFGLVHVSCILPEWQAVKLAFFAPWVYWGIHLIRCLLRDSWHYVFSWCCCCCYWKERRLKNTRKLNGNNRTFLKHKKITWLLTAAMYDASLSILIDRMEASDSGIYSKEKRHVQLK